MLLPDFLSEALVQICVAEVFARFGTLLTKAAGGIGRSGHGSGTAAIGCVRREFDGRWIRQANAAVQLQMLFAARRTVSFARIFIAEAGQLIASADAVAVAGFRCGLNGNKGHDSSQSTVQS